ncbi:MAG: type II secretion system protein GspJ [Pirellulales bacterium]
MRRADVTLNDAMAPWPHCKSGIRQRGFTLLEIMVALALVAVLFSLLGMAINLYMRAAQQCRAGVETAVLARNLLDMMAQELRSTLSVPDAGTGATNGGAEEEGVGAEDENDDGASEGGDPGALKDSSDGPLSDEPLLAVTPRPAAGLRGTTTAIEFDLVSLPRPERLALPESVDPAASAVRPMAIQTIQYSVRAMSDTVVGPSARQLERGSRDTVGLVRQQWDRIVLLSTSELGGTAGEEGVARMLASEVRAIEFRYWDGVVWTGTWDSAQQGELPAAVEVAIVLSLGTDQHDVARVPAGAGSLFERAEDAERAIYRRVIDLPTAWQTATAGTGETAP